MAKFWWLAKWSWRGSWWRKSWFHRVGEWWMADQGPRAKFLP